MNTQEINIHTIAEWLGTGSINIFGLPFAGKDTQGAKLAEVFNGVLISGGDILRHAKENAEVQNIMASGGIIPSELFQSIVVPYLSREELRGKPLILSEVGRLRGEDEVILHATEASEHPTKAVILLHLPDAEIWKRFDAAAQAHDRGDRADDNKAVLQTRLDNYHEKVMPVIDFYKEKGLLITVDGTKSKEDVFAEIISQLYEQAAS
jgi:adenylate kinase